MSRNDGFVQDGSLKHWSYVPKGMNEASNFAYCPVCKTPMNLVRGFSPQEVALPERERVEATIGPMTEEP